MAAVSEYTLRRSPRARQVRVSVESDGAVRVTLPRRAPLRAADDAVRELAPWIERRRRALARAAAELARTPGTVPYLGTELRLVPEPGRTRVHRRCDSLFVPADAVMAAGNGPVAPASGAAACDAALATGSSAVAAIERWYRRAARAEIVPRLDAAVARAGASYTRLTIRGQRTRWGSCSQTGAMSFNWRLLLAPEPVLDYVVEHEVCHLEVMDHSRRFWRLLESRVPDWRVQAAWLRRYGSALTL
jgi:predicted metal-dependent hydrolase